MSLTRHGRAHSMQNSPENQLRECSIFSWFADMKLLIYFDVLVIRIFKPGATAKVKTMRKPVRPNAFVSRCYFVGMFPIVIAVVQLPLLLIMKETIMGTPVRPNCFSLSFLLLACIHHVYCCLPLGLWYLSLSAKTPGHPQFMWNTRFWLFSIAVDSRTEMVRKNPERENTGWDLACTIYRRFIILGVSETELCRDV